jgi:hypothetical protein
MFHTRYPFRHTHHQLLYILFLDRAFFGLMGKRNYNNNNNCYYYINNNSNAVDINVLERLHFGIFIRFFFWARILLMLMLSIDRKV